MDPDRFGEALAGQPAGSDRPEEPWAVLNLVLATPLQMDADVDSVIEHLQRSAELAEQRIRAIKAVVAAGWEMEGPSLRVTDPAELAPQLAAEAEMLAARQTPVKPLVTTDYIDIDLRFRKQFPNERAAEHDVRGLELPNDTWSLLWDVGADGSFAWAREADGIS